MPSRQRQSAATSSGRDGASTSWAPCESASRSNACPVAASCSLPSASATTTKAGRSACARASGNARPAMANVAPSRNSIAAGCVPLAIAFVTAAAPSPAVGVEGDHGPAGLRRRDQLQTHGGHDPERALRADHERADVVARHVLAQPPAEADELARCDRHLEARHPGAGDAVLERVRPAGVGRDVAAELRLLGGAGIGRVVEAVLAREPLHLVRRDAALDLAAPLERLERPDRPQPGEGDDDPAVGNGAARVAAAAAARGQGHVVLVAPRERADDVVGRPREHDGVGAAAQAAGLRRVEQVRRDGIALQHGRVDGCGQLSLQRSCVHASLSPWRSRSAPRRCSAKARAGTRRPGGCSGSTSRGARCTASILLGTTIARSRSATASAPRRRWSPAASWSRWPTGSRRSTRTTSRCGRWSRSRTARTCG